MKYNIKNKKGFTLVELLIVIVIMTSILILAIISVNTISDKNKEKAWVDVQNEVKLAAKEYFNSNEYIHSTLSNDAVMIISVGKLVEEDYLNIVTNPKTGKKLSKCDKVEVKKDENGKLIFSYKSDDGICDNDTVTLSIKSNKDAPTLEVDKTCNSDSGFIEDWCRADVTNNLKVTFSNNQSSAYYIKKYIKTSGECSLNDIENKSNYDGELVTVEGNSLTYSEDKDVGSVCYHLTSLHGNTVAGVVFGIDKTAPEITVTTDTSNWVKTNVNYNYSASDSKSGLSSVVGYWNLNGKTQTEADSNDCKWQSDSYGKNTCRGSSSANYIKTENIGIKSSSGGSVFSSDGVRKIRYIACDKVGNCATSNEGIAKIDKTAPIVSVTTDTSNWVKTDVNYNYSASDSFSGLTSLVGYWNKSGLTQSKSDSNDCKWQGSSYGNSKCAGNNGNNLVQGGETTYSNTGRFAAEGVRKIRFIACDGVGNCATSSGAVAKIDKSAPTVSVTTETSSWVNRNVSYDYSASDSLSGLTSLVGYWNKSGLTQSKSDSSDCKWQGSSYGNSKCAGDNGNNLVQGGETTYSNTGRFAAEGVRKIRFIACDGVGNCATSSGAVAKIEKTVTVSFNRGLTNQAVSDSSDTTANGHKVFNTSYAGICSYGNCSNINCKTDSNKTETCSSNRFARACQYVDTYPRFFNVQALSYNGGEETIIFATDAEKSSAKIGDTTYYKSSNMTRSDDVKRYNTEDEVDSAYYYKTVGDASGGTNNFSAHAYTFTTPAGNTSSAIRLYTEYITNCGYYYK